MIKAIDFFCGAGGLLVAYEMPEFTVPAGVDNDAGLKDTYERDNAPSRFIFKDIKSIQIGDSARNSVLEQMIEFCMQPAHLANRFNAQPDAWSG